MSGHTKGPWSFGHLGSEVLWIGPDYNQTPVAHVDHGMEYARDNSRANAEFIVRACNSHYALLEALELCEDIIDDFVGHLDAEQQAQDPDVGVALVKARAAISLAKATPLDALIEKGGV